MTQPAEQMIVDPYNVLLSSVATNLSTGVAEMNGQQVFVATYRTASTTFHILCSREEAIGMGRLWMSTAESMSEAGLVAASPDEAAAILNPRMNGQPK